MARIDVVILAQEQHRRDDLKELGEVGQQQHGDQGAMGGENDRHVVQVRVDEVVETGDHRWLLSKVWLISDRK